MIGIALDWNAPVYIYCERGSDPAFWAEPFNAVSNLAFIIAASLGLRDLLRQPAASRYLEQPLLVGGVFTIGIGSFLFHTHANRWSELADVIPIGIVMLGLLAVMLARFLRLSLPLRLLAIVAFAGATSYAMRLQCGGAPCLNGSIGYVPALIGLTFIGAMLSWRSHPAAPRVLAAAGVFLVSLTLRTFDRTWCDAIGIDGHAIGTHFLWHTLNGVLLYLLLTAAIRHSRYGAPVPPKARPA